MFFFASLELFLSVCPSFCSLFLSWERRLLTASYNQKLHLGRCTNLNLSKDALSHSIFKSHSFMRYWRNSYWKISFTMQLGIKWWSIILKNLLWSLLARGKRKLIYNFRISNMYQCYSNVIAKEPSTTWWAIWLSCASTQLGTLWKNNNSYNFFFFCTYKTALVMFISFLSVRQVNGVCLVKK